MKMTKLLPPLALVGALALVPVTASSLAAADTTNYQELEKFMSVYERVKANYVDPVNDHTLIKVQSTECSRRLIHIRAMSKRPTLTNLKPPPTAIMADLD